MQIRFGPFTLDLDTRQLIRTGSAAEVLGRGQEIHLSPKAFDLLAALAAERPNAVSKEKIQERLWPQTFVAEANLSNLVAEVRDGLGDSARAPMTTGITIPAPFPFPLPTCRRRRKS